MRILPWRPRPTRVLIVCASNPCRSGLIQAGVVGRLAAIAKISPAVRQLNVRITAGRIRSAPGIDDPVAAQSLRRRSIRAAMPRPMAVTQESFVDADIVLASDWSTLRSLQRRCTSAHAHKLHLVLDFVPGRRGGELPQPSQGSADGYTQLLDLCDQAIIGLTKVILADSGRSPIRAAEPARAPSPANVGCRTGSSETATAL
jgi:protein-tyrosine phosphatase